MSSININRVVLTGNLTADPELRSLPSSTSVCRLRLATNTRRKDSASGEWIDKPNYFDITIWGAHGENVAKYTSRGSALAIDGRLEWREWDGEHGKRQAVDIIADTVQFLGSPNGRTQDDDAAAPTDEAPATAGGDDVPF
jgi:single-strand DNA-binding protein